MTAILNSGSSLTRHGDGFGWLKGNDGFSRDACSARNNDLIDHVTIACLRVLLVYDLLVGSLLFR